MCKSKDRCPLIFLSSNLLITLVLLAPSALLAYPGSVSIAGYVVNGDGWQECQANTPASMCLPSVNILNDAGGANKVVGWTSSERKATGSDTWEPVTSSRANACYGDTEYFLERNCESVWYIYIYPPACPTGYESSGDGRSCNLIEEPDPEKANGDNCTSVGNPINFSNGNKYQFEEDFTGSGLMPLQMHRHYNSSSGWSFIEELSITDVPSPSKIYECLLIDLDPLRLRCEYSDQISTFGVVASISMANGQSSKFEATTTAGSWFADPDVVSKFETLGSPIDPLYKFTDTDDLSYVFDSEFRLLEKIHPSGQRHQYTYLANEILITDSFGKSVRLEFNVNDQLIAFYDPSSNQFNYTHFLDRGFGIATMPDTTIRQYQYSDATNPYALTGIYDENTNLMASWQYDAEGRAYWSEHNYGLEISQVDYSNLEEETDPRVMVTNPLGKQTTYHLEDYFGVQKVVSVEGHASTNCAASNMSYTYDSSGFVASSTDWNGNLTTFVRDSRGREISRTEAVGTSEERTITMEWHATFNLVTATVTANSRIEFIYDVFGNLTRQSETPMN